MHAYALTGAPLDPAGDTRDTVVALFFPWCLGASSGSGSSGGNLGTLSSILWAYLLVLFRF